jgi:hypothetical protein
MPRATPIRAGIPSDAHPKSPCVSRVKLPIAAVKVLNGSGRADRFR